MGVSNMQGSPWHVELLKNKPGEKCRCIHKKNELCTCTISNHFKKICPGRADCSEYESVRSVAKSYSKVHKPNPSSAKPKHKHKKKKSTSKANLWFK